MKKILIILCLGFSTFSYGKDFKMVQAGKTFLGDVSDTDLEGFKNKRGKFSKSKVKKKVVKEISLNKGDSITFYNKDSVTHNVTNPGLKVNLKQEAGKDTKDKVVFDKPGDYTFRCAIHPKMKLKIKVK